MVILANHSQAREVEVTFDALDLAHHTQARVPDGINYTTAFLRYPGHKVPITCMSRRNPNDPHQGFEGLQVDGESTRPQGDENFQRGLTLEWIIPRGHWVAVGDNGLANWLRCGFSERELQAKVLSPDMRCSHECPQLDTLIDRGRFKDNCENQGVQRGEHVDPREQTDDIHWGLGFLNNLTEVVAEDVTAEEETSSDDSSTEVTEPLTTSSDEDVGEVKHVYIFSCTDIRYR